MRFITGVVLGAALAVTVPAGATVIRPDDTPAGILQSVYGTAEEQQPLGGCEFERVIRATKQRFPLQQVPKQREILIQFMACDDGTTPVVITRGPWMSAYGPEYSPSPNQ